MVAAENLIEKDVGWGAVLEGRKTSGEAVEDDSLVLGRNFRYGFTDAAVGRNYV